MDEKYPNEKKKVDDFYNSIYGTKKILISDFYSNYSSSFLAKKVLVYYSDQFKLLLIDNSDNRKISFSSKQSARDKEFNNLYKIYKCYEKKTYQEYYNCNNIYEKKYRELQIKYKEIVKDTASLDYEYYFYPLAKYQAVENIFTQVDFWLFDYELAKKKWTEVEETSSTD